MQDKTVIGDNLKLIRKHHGYTQHKFGELLDVKNMTISAYEKGKIVPSNKVLSRLSEIFKIDIDSLLNRRFTQDSIELIIGSESSYQMPEVSPQRKEIIHEITKSLTITSSKGEDTIKFLDGKCNEMLHLIKLLPMRTDTTKLLDLNNQGNLEYEKFKFIKLTESRRLAYNKAEIEKAISHRIKFILELIEFAKTSQNTNSI